VESQERRPDVIFISFEEPDADANFARLLKFAPHARRVHHVAGIFNAYRAALALVSTPYFFVVDGDNWILDGFRFVAPPETEQADIWMWRARNGVNGLELMNGALKLLNREAVMSMDAGALDFTASMKGSQRVINFVASETRFNSSPFLAWRSGFRECAKFANGLVDNPSIPRIMKIWQTVGADKPNGHWCMLGARMGADFGRRFAGTEVLRSINDMAWMKSEFEKAARAHAPALSQGEGGDLPR
jgi:hypothetical protein